MNRFVIGFVLSILLVCSSLEFICIRAADGGSFSDTNTNGSPSRRLGTLYPYKDGGVVSGPSSGENGGAFLPREELDRD